jgi:hypothetical protein
MKNVVLWNVRGVAIIGTDVSEYYAVVILVVFLHSVLRLLVTANIPSSPISVTLMMEAIRCSETSVLTVVT